MEKYRVAIVGRGLVGQELIKCLKESAFFWNCKPEIFATSSAFQFLAGEFFEVKEAKPENFDEKIDIALFAGTEGEKGLSQALAEPLIEKGITIIDNGGDFRGDPEVPLVVPEINPEALEEHKGLIANPNCSTIQMVLSLWPIHKVSPLKRIIISTYQSVSGSGRGGEEELEEEIKTTFFLKEGRVSLSREINYQPKFYSQQVAFNVFPEIGQFDEEGFTAEERKTINETHKIFGDSSIAISPLACVRVPVFRGHSESIYIETERKISAQEAREILSGAPGVKLVDELTPTEKDKNRRNYLTALDAAGKNWVGASRVREDPFRENSLILWVVADNIRKGAALNAVQITEELVKRNFLKMTSQLKPEERWRKDLNRRIF